MPFQIQFADILSIRCDAIVNPTDEHFSGSGGLDAQLHAAAGSEMDSICGSLAPLDVGDAAITPGHCLNSLYVIHTVAPWWTNREADVHNLRRCYRSALRLAEENQLQSLAFPLIGSGTRGFPKELVLRVAVEEIGEYLKSHDADIRLVIHDRSEFRPDPVLLAGLEDYISSLKAEEERRRRVERPGMFSVAPTFSQRINAKESRPAAKQRQKGFRLPDFSAFSRRREKKSPDDRDESCSADNAPGAVYPSVAKEDAGFEEELSFAPSQRESKLEDTATFSGIFEPERGAILDESFSQMVLRLIDEKGFKKDSECYTRANIDRRLFSKIRSDESYHPKKATALALAVALELSLPETGELLMKAGYSLSHSILFDVIVEYCILQKNYNIYEINELLFQYDQPLLGA